MNQGKLYGIGVGPGDPELLTRKAVRLMKECDVIAVPKGGSGEQTALNIAAEFIAGKPILHCDMPMTRDKQILNACHDKAADDICALLDDGKNVAFLTLGDPAVYSTYWYVHRRVQARGYFVEIVPGVPSFCAAAARLGQALCEGSQMLHIIPASHNSTQEGLALPGNKILMKAGRSILEVRDLLEAEGKLDTAALVERCSMEGERVVRDLRELDDPTGYFSIILVREEQK